jgi:hypothetical protein
MKPMLGWTMLSWDEMRQVERALSGGEQDTRDEIGFLLIHQGFADRFFPGTSVLHTRIRYALLSHGSTDAPLTTYGVVSTSMPRALQRCGLNREYGTQHRQLISRWQPPPNARRYCY